jgi:hypothetical protein
MATSNQELYKALASENITENSHHDGITPASFGLGQDSVKNGNDNLKSFFDVLSTNFDGTGKAFVR